MTASFHSEATHNLCPLDVSPFVAITYERPFPIEPGAVGLVICLLQPWLSEGGFREDTTTKAFNGEASRYGRRGLGCSQASGCTEGGASDPQDGCEVIQDGWGNRKVSEAGWLERPEKPGLSGGGNRRAGSWGRVAGTRRRQVGETAWTASGGGATSGCCWHWL